MATPSPVKPQLIIQDLQTVGLNNGAIRQKTASLKAQAAWKKQRVIVLLPSAKMISAKVALTHRNLVFPPNNASVWMLALEMEVGEAYSTAIEQVLAHPELSTWEYILTIESDNMPPSDGLLKLIERMEANPKYDCIGGLYFVKGAGAPAQIWGDPKDPVLNFRPQLPDPGGGLVECNGTGMGFNLWRTKLFKNPKLRRPWFVTKKGEGGVSTQDLYFWADAKKYGVRCAIDCSVRVGHYDVNADVTW